MRRRRAALLTTALAALAVGAVPAQGAPPTGDGTHAAPYGGFATFGSNVQCAEGATCDATGSADSVTGRGATTSSYARETAVEGRESAFGYALQAFTVKTRPTATRVSATFTWRVDASAVEASATAGTMSAYTGVAAYAPACDGACSSETGSALVEYTRSNAGRLPYVPEPAQSEVSVTVTASGKLPRQLTFYAYPYSFVSGDRQQLCVVEGVECQTTSETHAGTARASIDAVLTGVSVTSS